VIYFLDVQMENTIFICQSKHYRNIVTKLGVNKARNKKTQVVMKFINVVIPEVVPDVEAFPEKSTQKILLQKLLLNQILILNLLNRNRVKPVIRTL
jgi:hypothetical protein